MYDPEHVADGYGALTDQRIEFAAFAAFEIGPQRCEADLARLEPFNR